MREYKKRECDASVGFRGALQSLPKEENQEKAQELQAEGKGSILSFRKGVLLVLRRAVSRGICNGPLRALLHQLQMSRAKRHTCKARAIKKDILETIVLSVLLKLLSDDERRYIADCIYSEQKKEPPEITSMKKRRNEVEKKIENFVKAIGMEIVTDQRSRHCSPLNPREAGWTRSFPNYLLIPKASRRMKSDGP